MPVQFDSRKGATWHCIVGRNFGSYVTHGRPVLSVAIGWPLTRRRDQALHIFLPGTLRHPALQDAVSTGSAGPPPWIRGLFWIPCLTRLLPHGCTIFSRPLGGRAVVCPWRSGRLFSPDGAAW